MGVQRHIVQQFERPSGALGQLAGWIMANRPSNRQRNLWTLDLLAINPSDCVLEFGCGPGLALAETAYRASRGRIVGIDHSPLMIRQAERRVRSRSKHGHAKLITGGLQQLPAFSDGFDVVYSVNVIQFIDDKTEALKLFHEALVPGGRVAITYQPRHKNPTAADAFTMAAVLKTSMAEVGFEDIRIEELSLAPVPAVAVLGRRPSAI